MDKGLILSVLLVLLSLEFMAHSTAAATNNTTASTNMTLNETVTNNATITTASINASTVAPANSTTMVTTVSNVTASANTSTATTTAASENIPGVEANISRQGCRSTKLCAAEPTECNPAAGDSCYFLSVKQKINQTFDFELSGQAAGYIAAGLSTAANQAGNHRAYICANNNGGVKFFTATLNNFVLNFTESLNSSNQRGTVNGGKIHCTFTAVLPDTTTRAAAFAMSILTGSLDANGKPGKPDFRLLTALVNLSDPTVNITNLLNSNTTSSAFPVTPTHGSFLPALLVTVCMLAFTAM
ncbi:putative ferric-chelate reductase 1 [Girardinichthys multiradiatus]|uniref:putative ferric-chelate reductase 1 n=1 Tax=Girardinichthys multiradiatus TaxID=208333 RepID=UPI001FAC694F|nr:putative ferric-chelate reductase 1 [Girardinichthys multiradiatus]